MKKRLALLGSAILVLAVTFGFSFRQEASATVPGVNQLVSQSSSGSWANAGSGLGNPVHTISGDGRYVLFTSSASNLVSGDTNGAPDVFLRDTQANTTTLVDVSSSGVEANNGASSGAISYDGRYIVFASSATNLVSGVSGAEVYERDLSTGTTTLASTNTAGAPVYGQASDDVNADGRYVVFTTNSSGVQAITGTADGYSGNNFLRLAIKDMVTGTTQLIGGTPYGANWFPTIDCDGHVVAFSSQARLTSDTPTFSYQQYGSNNYYYSTIDWNTNPVFYINNTDSNKVNSPQVSCNGNYMVTNLSSTIREYDRLTKTGASVNGTDNSTGASSGYIRANSISDDGRYIAFISSGTNIDSSYSSAGRGSYYDVFVRDMRTSSNQLVTFTTTGSMSGLVSNQGVSISPDGSKVVYSYATPSASGSGNELISGVDTGQQDVYESETGF